MSSLILDYHGTRISGHRDLAPTHRPEEECTRLKEKDSAISEDRKEQLDMLWKEAEK